MSNHHSNAMAVAQPAEAAQDENLTRVLKPIHLWSLAVGLVISGNYFGWSYGFAAGGVMGLALALIPVTIFYVTFILSYSELATAIPHAGGPSAYARRAMGKFGGYLNGISCLIEFVFAPPAIALAVGGYVHALGLGTQRGAGDIENAEHRHGGFPGLFGLHGGLERL